MPVQSPFVQVSSGQVGSGNINTALADIQSDNFIRYTAGADIAAGDVVVVNDIVCYAPHAIANGATGWLDMGGVHDIPKYTDVAVLQGQKINWDSSSEIATLSATSNYAGVAIAAAAEAVAAVRVKFAGAGT